MWLLKLKRKVKIKLILTEISLKLLKLTIILSMKTRLMLIYNKKNLNKMKNLEILVIKDKAFWEKVFNQENMTLMKQ